MALRDQILRGGSYLIFREGLGLCVSIVGVLFLTRLIGPTSYGLYAGALSLASFLSGMARFGLDVYLVRRQGTLEASVYHQAFTFLLVTSIGIVGLALLIFPVLAHGLIDRQFLPPLQVLLFTLPLSALSALPIAQLERALEYRKVAGLEVTGQLLHYALALPLAWSGAGVWAPVSGYFLLQMWTMAASYVMTHYRPRWYWSGELLREMTSYGFGYSASMWVWQLRGLVNTLIVGRYLGPEGVGYVALATRIVETFCFVKAATWRLSIVALGKVQQDLARLRRALEEAMGMQVLALGPLLAVFGSVAPWLLPRFFGKSWLPTLSIYSFIAVSYLVNVVFSMHSSVLYVLRHNWWVTTFHLTHVVLLVASSWVLVPWLGLVGYGLAEMVAMVSYLVLHAQLARVLSFDYRRAWPWLAAFGPPILIPLVGLPWGLGLWVSALPLLVSGAARSQMWEYWVFIRRREV